MKGFPSVIRIPYETKQKQEEKRRRDFIMRKYWFRGMAVAAAVCVMAGGTSSVAYAHHGRGNAQPVYCYADGSCDVDGVCQIGADCDGTVHHDGAGYCPRTGHGSYHHSHR